MSVREARLHKQSLGPLCCQSKQGAFGEKLCAHMLETLLSKAGQEGNNKHKERLNLFYGLSLGQ